MPAIADDSGLEVDALHGAPGIPPVDASYDGPVMHLDIGKGYIVGTGYGRSSGYGRDSSYTAARTDGLLRVC